MTPNESPTALLPTIDELTKRQAHDDPVFAAWRDSVPDKHWCKLDLSALRIGYELGRSIASTAPGASESVWRCTQCGELLDETNPAWRWTGSIWQHHHERVGHVDAQRFCASESRWSVPEPLTVSMCINQTYADGWNACRGAMLAAAPTPPAVASGEPTAEQWERAFAEWYASNEHNNAFAAWEFIKKNALARSAAAKGEG